MVLPTMAVLFQDALRQVPATCYAGSLALGATADQTLVRLIWPRRGFIDSCRVNCCCKGLGEPWRFRWSLGTDRLSSQSIGSRSDVNHSNPYRSLDIPSRHRRLPSTCVHGFVADRRHGGHCAGRVSVGEGVVTKRDRLHHWAIGITFWGCWSFISFS